MKTAFAKIFWVLSLAMILSAPQFSHAQAIEEKPSAVAMTADLVIARPVLAAVTVLGTAAFIVSLPFSLIGGNTKEAADAFVVGPAKSTFVRCLGCTKVGRKKEVTITSED